MKKMRFACLVAACAVALPSLLMMGGCDGGTADVILRVYSWAEYIDEGGRGTFLFDELHELDEYGKPVTDQNGRHIHIESDIVDDEYKAWYEDSMGVPLDPEAPALLDDFCRWYEKEYGQSIRVEYATFGTNEDMYNEIVLGNDYDLLCPSDYMIMKLAAEDRIVPYDASFFLTEGEGSENNYYAKYVSPYIDGVFRNGKVSVPTEEGTEEHSWREYAAGYMWGTTGFVYNPDPAGDGSIDVEADLDRLDWKIFTDPVYQNKITAKDNVRDTYFAALGVTYRDELLALPHDGSYNAALTEIFNRTDEEAVGEVRETLMAMKGNIYGFETDTGKADLVSRKIWLNYAWSGDAVYALNEGEGTERTPENQRVYLNYYVPVSGSNLWFDGWVLTKGVETRGTKQAAQAFVNFMSMPKNAMRNSYYIGYTSVIAGDDMLDYARYLYEDEEADEVVSYDLGYFFGDTASDEPVFLAEKSQAEKRQLFAQYPPKEVIESCAVMNYFDADTNERINELWSQVKAETLDEWAIAVICITVVAIVAFLVFVKFGNRIDFFRRKPKKGYTLYKQDSVL